MRIGIIGAGRAGGALGLALADAGHRVVAVADVVPARAAELARELGAGVRPAAEVAEAADIVLLSVPDGVIADAAAALAPWLADLSGRVFLHLSGAHPADLLSPLRVAGAIGSFHPLVSLAEARSGAERLRGCFFALEGEPEAVAAGQVLAASLGGRVILLCSADKIKYHAAAVMASNYLVGLIDIALGLYERIGLNKAAARQALWPLVEATVANLRAFGPEVALTGPIARGDLATVQSHLAELDAEEPVAAVVYRSLGQATTALASRAGRIDRQQARALHALLTRRNG